MSIKRAIGQAVKLYQSFREARPKSVGALRVRIPRAVAVMGYVEAIDYRTTHGGKTELYRHDFAQGSRPLLAVSSDGKQLLLLGGRYQFTDQGIVDKDARGKLITNPGHGKAINPRKGNPKDAREMTAGQINRRLDRLDALASQHTDAFIAAGRGHERFSDWSVKTDPLSRAALAVSEERRTLHSEIERRYGPGAPHRLPAKFGRARKRNTRKAAASALPKLARHEGSWIVTAPDGTTMELFEAKNALKALKAGWRVEPAGQYLARVNREIAGDA